MKRWTSKVCVYKSSWAIYVVYNLSTICPSAWWIIHAINIREGENNTVYK